MEKVYVGKIDKKDSKNLAEDGHKAYVLAHEVNGYLKTSERCNVNEFSAMLKGFYSGKPKDQITLVNGLEKCVDDMGSIPLDDKNFNCIKDFLQIE